MKMDGMPQPKSNEKCTPFLDCSSSFEGTSYKNLLDTVKREYIFRDSLALRKTLTIYFLANSYLFSI